MEGRKARQEGSSLPSVAFFLPAVLPCKDALYRAHGAPFPQVIKVAVDDRSNQQGQQQAEDLAAQDGHGHRRARAGAGAATERDRNHAGDDGDRRHENRAQAHVVGLDQRCVPLDDSVNRSGISLSARSSTVAPSPRGSWSCGTRRR